MEGSPTNDSPLHAVMPSERLVKVESLIAIVAFEAEYEAELCTHCLPPLLSSHAFLVVKSQEPLPQNARPLRLWQATLSFEATEALRISGAQRRYAF